MDIKEKIKGFPDSPGVYLMKDKAGRILYAGKASSLKKRISSYFQKPPTAKTQILLERTADIDYIKTSSGAQALLLENALIKRDKPFYNAALKDDKSYPYVKISTVEDYPYLLITRGKKEKEARYFGPYTNAKLLKAAIKAIRAIFPFRSCRRLPKSPCLYMHLKLCPGMCVVKIDKRIYQENLRQLGLFLEGEHEQLLKILQDKMNQAARDELFEQAALLRDRINSLTEIIAQTKEPSRGDLILELQNVLGLARLPQRIEAFDISEIAGEGLSGSMVSFLGGWPDKKNYRRFRIKTVQGIDDYAMVAEVLRRRFGKTRSENMPSVPDLVMIDGGKGHLTCAQKELRGLGLKELPVIALAKRLETVYTPKGEAINLPKDARPLHLLQRIRDEAHRFAVSYHRKLRQEGMRMSSLDEIAGIGPKRKRALLRHFKSVQQIKKASLKDLLKVKGIDRRTAEYIVKYFKIKNLNFDL